jgi:hypothetical protein
MGEGQTEPARHSWVTIKSQALRRASPLRGRQLVPAAGRPIGRSRAARPGRLQPCGVGHACAAHGVAAQDLLTLFEAIVGAIESARCALQAIRLLFTLCVCWLMRRGDQCSQRNSRCKRRSAHGRSLSVFLAANEMEPGLFRVRHARTPAQIVRWHARCEIGGRITPPPRRARRHPTRGRRPA